MTESKLKKNGTYFRCKSELKFYVVLELQNNLIKKKQKINS